jgi:hypothetical protein
MIFSRSELESSGIGGKTPVDEKKSDLESILSTAGHEESRGKQGGPPPKAKYSLATDSEQVP